MGAFVEVRGCGRARHDANAPITRREGAFLEVRTGQTTARPAAAARPQVRRVPPAFARASARRRALQSCAVSTETVLKVVKPPSTPVPTTATISDPGANVAVSAANAKHPMTFTSRIGHGERRL